MDRNCQECQPFIDETERLFGSTLRKYAFELTVCEGMRQGRECQLMYSAAIGNLLFLLQDGVPGSYFGKGGTPFPTFVLIHGVGEFGWYDTFTLAEVESGEETLTRRLIRQFKNNQVDMYEWDANLVEARTKRLFHYLDTNDEETVIRMMQDRRHRNTCRWE